MIVGLFVKNIKTYSGINFIPLTYNNNFCGIIGKNGCGKSSVLEALDYVFNNRAEWNYHISYKKQGLAKTTPYVVPVFLIAKNTISDPQTKEIVEKYSQIFWRVHYNEVNSSNAETCKQFIKHRDNIVQYVSKDNYYLMTIGCDYERKTSLSIFDTLPTIDKLQIDKLRKIIFNLYDYVYIPKDIEPEKMMKLETEELQIVLGKTLQDIISDIFDQEKIFGLNRKLLEFTNKLSDQLGEYEFKTSQERQIALRRNSLYDLIIEDFFKKRKLHKTFQGRSISISMLSSGEKQQAILDLYYNLIKFLRESKRVLIIGIDEPEASLHISACYNQFNKLYELCSPVCQTIFTTHWYGFIPTIEQGGIVNISTMQGEHKFDIFDIERYREQIRQQIVEQKRYLPLDISLKSINDFIQSIISSLMQETPYNWLICEGSSDKVYLEAYFRDVIKANKLRIIPVGGVGEIAKIYKQLLIFFDDQHIKKEIKGKVFLLSDTDSELHQYPIKHGINNLENKRLLLDEREDRIKLVNIDCQFVSPATDIEDSMNGKICKRVLQTLKESTPLLSFIDDDDASEKCAAVALNLNRENTKKLKEFYNTDNNKFLCAKRYVEYLSSGDNKVPEWILEIKKYFE